MYKHLLSAVELRIIHEGGVSKFYKVLDIGRRIVVRAREREYSQIVNKFSLLSAVLVRIHL